MIGKILIFMLLILGTLFSSFSISLFSPEKDRNKIFIGLTIGVILYIIAFFIAIGL